MLAVNESPTSMKREVRTISLKLPLSSTDQSTLHAHTHFEKTPRGSRQCDFREHISLQHQPSSSKLDMIDFSMLCCSVISQSRKHIVLTNKLYACLI